MPGSPRIVNVTLDEHTVVRRSPEVEHERAIAIFDLLEDKHEEIEPTQGISDQSA